jgi:hypothetical protein
MPYEVFKKLDPSDYTVTPFEAHKKYTISDENATSNGLIVREGQYISSSFYAGDSWWDAETDNTTEPTSSDGVYQRATWAQIYNLYYRYPNDPGRSFGTHKPMGNERQISKRITVFAVSQSQYGESIQPGTVTINDYSTASTITLKDDGFGNLYDTSVTTTNFAPTSSLVSYSSFYNGFMEERFLNGKKRDKSPTTPWEVWDETPRFNDGNAYDTDFLTGKYGSAPHFKGTTPSYFRVPHHSDYNFRVDQDFAISFWVKAQETQLDTATTSNVIMSKWGKTKKVNNTAMTVEDNFAGGGEPFHIRMYNHTQATKKGRILFRRSDTTIIPAIESTTNVADDAYHHIVAQKSGSKLELWVDGTKEADATDSTLGDTHNLSDLFFAKNGNDLHPWSGSLDEVRIYNTFLSTSEITSLYTYPKNTNVVGSVFYKHGITAVTSPDTKFDNFGLDEGADGYTYTFKGTHTIYEHEVLCAVEEGEFNGTANPTVRVNNDLELSEQQAFVTHSEFSPYVTSIGLYNDKHQMVAVGKMSRPIKNAPDLPITFLVRIDT